MRRRTGSTLTVACSAVVTGLLASATLAQLPTPVPADVVVPVWRAKVPSPNAQGWEYFTSSNWSEVASRSPELLYYAPVAGTITLYRHFKSSNPIEHLDSTSPTPPPGYVTEGQSTALYTPAAATAGTFSVAEFLNAAQPDHALRGYSLSIPAANTPGPVSLTPETITGYGSPTTLGYAYPRFRDASTKLLTLTAGGVAVSSNLNAGGAVWNWTHNGKQYVNVRDYGRQIQAAVFVNGYSDAHAASYPVALNPTEAGDWYTDQSRPGARRYGSPILTASNAGNVQSTRAIPLEWNPQHFGGGEDARVIYSKAQLGKDVTLNYNGMGPVAMYQTRYLSPMNTPNTQVEVPTGYVTADLKSPWTYDPGATDPAQRLKQATLSINSMGVPSVGFRPASGYGGVITANASGTYAMGVYGVSTWAGGSIDYLTLWDFTGGSATTDPNTGATVKWSAVYGPGTANNGRDYTYTSWVMTGTLQEVTGYMQQLYDAQLAGTVPKGGVGLTVDGTSSTWAVDASSTWSASDSWSGAVPNGTDAVAIFGANTTAARTITVGGATTVGTLFLQNPKALTFSGSGSIALSAAIGPAVVAAHGKNATHTISVPVTAVTDAWLNVDAGTTLALSSTLTSTGRNITKTESGTLLLSAANNVSGTFTVREGTLAIAHIGALGSAAATVTSGGQLSVKESLPSGTTFTNAVTLSGIGPDEQGALRFRRDASTYTWSGPIAVSGTGRIGYYGANSTLNLPSRITGAGNLSLWGGGGATSHVTTFVLSGKSTYTGGTSIEADFGANTTARLSGGADRLPVSTVLTFNPATFNGSPLTAELALNGYHQTVAGIQVGAGATGNARVVNGSPTAAMLTVNNASDYTYAGSLGGPDIDDNNLSLSKSGTGTLTLTGANTYVGTTTVSGGVLRLANAAALGSSANPLTVSAGTLDLNGVSLTVGPLGGAAGVIRNSSTSAATLTVNSATTTTFSGTIQNGSGAVSLVKNGTGSLVLAGANSFTGTINVKVGSLVVRHSAALGTAAKTVYVNNGSAGNSRLHLDGSAGGVILPAALTLQTSWVDGTLINDAGNNTVLGNILLTGGGGDTTVVSDAGTLTLAGAIYPTTSGRQLRLDGPAAGTVSGQIRDNAPYTLNVIKQDAGTWTFTGDYTYTGSTAVVGGRLVIAAPFTTGSSLSITGNATAETAAGGSNLLRTTSLALSPAGKLDLNDNNAIIDYAATSPAPSVRQWLLSGRNGGDWAGTGITSSTAAADPHRVTAVAYAVAGDLGITDFAGRQVDPTSLLLTLTRYGDLNLDGGIDADDYVRLDRGLARSLAGWVNGDVNYDGAVNTGDNLLIDRAFVLEGGAPLSPDFLAEREARFGPSYVSALVASVPEPGLLGPALVGLSLLPAHRGRRSR